jgi:hypothetical protein
MGFSPDKFTFKGALADIFTADIFTHLSNGGPSICHFVFYAHAQHTHKIFSSMLSNEHARMINKNMRSKSNKRMLKMRLKH